ncbi:transposase [Desulfococcaceae bacterium HSG8]|nr:transposase [Desulfococcaceae bacterium HSG8]
MKKHKVTELLRYEYEKETESRTKYVGRGRGSSDREKEVVVKIRYQITAVIRDESRIEKEKERFGWRAYVTDIPKERPTLSDAVKCYRKEYRIESVFRRLKSRMNASPLYVRRDDQIRRMTCLLTLGVRVLTLTEFVVLRSLKNDNAALGGLHPENRRKETDRPAAERLLKAFSDITLTVIKTTDGRVTHHLTPLSEVQKEILRRAGLNPSLYRDLEINKSPPQLTE